MRKQLIEVGMEHASTDVSFSSVQDIVAYVVETQGFTKQYKSFPWGVVERREHKVKRE